MVGEYVNFPFLDAVIDSLPNELRGAFQDTMQEYRNSNPSLNPSLVFDYLVRFVVGAEYSGYVSREGKEWDACQVKLRKAIAALDGTEAEQDQGPEDEQMGSEEHGHEQAGEHMVFASFLQLTFKINITGGREMLLGLIATKYSIPCEFLQWIPPCDYCQELGEMAECPQLKTTAAHNKAFINMADFKKCKKCQSSPPGGPPCAYSQRRMQRLGLLAFVIGHWERLDMPDFLDACDNYFSTAPYTV